MRRRRWRTRSPRRGIRLLRARVIGRRRLAYKIDRLARQRAVDEGLLLVPGYLHHVIADIAENEGDLDPRRLNIVQERRGEWAVTAVAVERGGTVARGIGDQYVADRLDTAEAAADRRT